MREILSALALATCLFPAVSTAQLRMAVLGGPQKASVDETNSLANWQETVKPGYKSRSGLHLGVLVEVPLSPDNKWAFYPGVIYSAKGREYFQHNNDDIASQTDTISVSSRFSTNYIDIPLNLGYKFPLGGKTNLLLSAGPYLAFFYNGKQTMDTRLLSSDKLIADEASLQVGNEAGKVSTLDFGINGRAGLEIGSVLLTAFYSKGLKDFYQANYEGSFRHQVIGASIGFWLNQPTRTVKAPKDSDRDGITDTEDACPTLAGPLLTHGCPDKDGDGVADNSDRCPDVPGLVSRKGCPELDNDHDGIANEEDKCPDMAGTKTYQGCPIPDTDRDGINDEFDACKDVPGLAEFKGCPVPDQDRDGVSDLEDKCPELAGSPANNGCPEIRKEVIQQVNSTASNIFFVQNSDKLSEPSLKALDELAALLQSDTSLLLKISGHTDNYGKADWNQQLSEKRAAAVSKYLVKKGVSAGRLVSEGFGDTRPLESNGTSAGRKKNRRVELAVSNQ